MAWVDPLPARAVADILSAEPYPRPFARKNWDNPVKFKLNRQYGDEFEYANFSQLRNRWTIRSAVAADFRFDGGSCIGWKSQDASGHALVQPLPPYDFDAVLEFTRDFGIGVTDNFPALGIVDASGNGFGIGVHQDANLYTNAISAWVNPATFSHLVASGFLGGQGHVWLCLRRTGGNIQGRASINGSTWTSFTTADAIGGTPVYLAIMRYRGGSGNGSFNAVLHRFNVYPAPTYFPG